MTKANKNRGWVKLWREQFQHWLSEEKPWCEGYAWSFLYAQANHRRAIVNFRNQYFTVERGQLITSILKLSEIYGWTWRRTRSFLESLEQEKMVEKRFNTKSHNESHNRQHNRFLLITILNYDKYQSREDEVSIIDSTINSRTGAEQEPTNNNDKNEKNNTYRGIALEVLSYLNEKTGRRYRDASYIEARLKDGGTVEECKAIIDKKLKDPYFINENPKYLNPITLFRKAHWDKYLNEPYKADSPKNDSQKWREDPGAARRREMEATQAIPCPPDLRPDFLKEHQD